MDRLVSSLWFHSLTRWRLKTYWVFFFPFFLLFISILMRWIVVNTLVQLVIPLLVDFILKWNGGLIIEEWNLVQKTGIMTTMKATVLKRKRLAGGLTGILILYCCCQLFCFVDIHALIAHGKRQDCHCLLYLQSAFDPYQRSQCR